MKYCNAVTACITSDAAAAAAAVVVAVVSPAAAVATAANSAAATAAVVTGTVAGKLLHELQRLGLHPVDVLRVLKCKQQ